MWKYMNVGANEDTDMVLLVNCFPILFLHPSSSIVASSPIIRANCKPELLAYDKSIFLNADLFESGWKIEISDFF